jgi:lipid-binding SYLF domain-containing protein
MTDSALNYLNQSGGWAIGTSPVLCTGRRFGRSWTTTNLRSDVYALVFNQQGLMGDLGIEGSKITQIKLNSVKAARATMIRPTTALWLTCDVR